MRLSPLTAAQVRVASLPREDRPAFGTFCTPPMAMPRACPHCKDTCFLTIEDGQPACWGCGWRPRRKPSAAERGECEPRPDRDRRRGPSTGGIRL